MIWVLLGFTSIPTLVDHNATLSKFKFLIKQGKSLILPIAEKSWSSTNNFFLLCLAILPTKYAAPIWRTGLGPDSCRIPEVIWIKKQMRCVININTCNYKRFKNAAVHVIQWGHQNPPVTVDCSLYVVKKSRKSSLDTETFYNSKHMDFHYRLFEKLTYNYNAKCVC